VSTFPVSPIHRRAPALTRPPTAMLLGAGAVLAICLLAAQVSADSLSRIAIGGVIALPLLTTAVQTPRRALYGLVIWLAVLGLVRRLTTSFGSTIGPLGDPLLLIGPLLLVALFLMAVRRGALRDLTTFSKLVLAFTVVLALSAVNPLQGGLSVGLAGAMLVVMPMLAFWVGRSLMDEHAIGVLVRVLGVLALLAAVYGLLQTFDGMPSWDSSWATTSGYAALNVGGAIRAFGLSSSAAEYAATLGVGILAWFAMARSPSRLLAAAVPIALLAIAIWLESSRGIVVLTLAALWLTAAAASRIRMAPALVVGALMLVLLPTVVRHLASSPQQYGTVASLTAHQVEGLSEPFGQNSTLTAHFEEVVNGISEAVSNPLGRGIGATTIAASKFGGTLGGTEADPGNAPVAAGAIGLILYLLIAGYGLARCYRLARARPSMATLAALGVVIVTFLQWLNGGQYAIIVLPWLFLGWVDSQSPRESVPAARAAAIAESHGQ
jgi:hypothetical protein